MGSSKLDEIAVTPLSRIFSPDGDVMHGMKSNEPSYHNFGEAYFSWIHYRKIKAWKKHQKMTLNLIAPLGEVRFIFYCEDSSTVFREERIGERNYVRLTVPPNIWFGFQGLAKPSSLILNLASINHDPDEVLRKHINEIRVSWD
jgi:dTDP-4-dehydrorhamnose 3,5-epimerase